MEISTQELAMLMFQKEIEIISLKKKINELEESILKLIEKLSADKSPTTE
jgi:hypothetical protein